MVDADKSRAEHDVSQSRSDSMSNITIGRSVAVSLSRLCDAKESNKEGRTSKAKGESVQMTIGLRTVALTILIHSRLLVEEKMVKECCEDEGKYYGVSERGSKPMQNKTSNERYSKPRYQIHGSEVSR